MDERTDIPSAIARYTPATPIEGWEEATGAFVRKLIVTTRSTSARDAYRLIAVAAPYVGWGLSHGIDLNPEHLLTPDRMEEYLATGNRAAWVHGTHIYVRWALRRIGVANTRRAPWRPTSRTPGIKTVTFPYTANEISRYLDAAQKQRTERRGRYMLAALALQHGAGLHSVELLRLRGRDLEYRESHWIVHLTEQHTAASHSPPRSVPVSVQYSTIVQQLVDGSGTGILAATEPATMSALKGLRSNLAYAARLPSFSPRRLRATWLRDALNTPVPLRAVLAAAGLNSLDFIALGPTLTDDAPARHAAIIAGAQHSPIDRDHAA